MPRVVMMMLAAMIDSVAGAADVAPQLLRQPAAVVNSIADPTLVSLPIEPHIVGLQRPVAVRSPGDGSGRLFVVEQPGRILVFDDGDLILDPFLDITGKVRD